MNRLRARSTSAALTTLLAALAAATLLAQPAAVVRCRVVSAVDSTPLRRARVVSVVEGRLPAPVFSDDEGRCEASAQSGTFVVRVSKSGFAPQDVRITVPAAAPIQIRLVPAAAISGRVIDSRGQAGVRVGVMIRRLDPPDAPQPAEARALTNDRGEYRLGNLVAGRYAIHTQRGMALTDSTPDLPAGAPAPAPAMSRDVQAQESMSDTVLVDVGPGEQVDVTLAHNAPSVSFPYEEGGIVTGTVFDEHGEPAEGARITLLAIGEGGMAGLPPESVADDRGQYRVYHLPPGPHLVVVTHATESKIPPGSQATVRLFGSPPDPTGSLPVYFPGTLDPGEAVPLRVERGRELNAIDMVAPRVRGSRVFGTIASGSAMDTPLELRPTGRSAAAWVTNRFARTSADGSFELHNVAPGTYVLQHVSRAPDDTPGAVQFIFASVHVRVGSEDVGPLTVAPAPTSMIRGRITLEGATDRVEPRAFQLMILPVDKAEAPAPSLISAGIAISTDWRFRISGLATTSRIGLARAPSGWWLKSVMIGAVNAAIEPAPFGSASESHNEVEIVLSRSGATLLGRVVDDRRQPIDLYNVIVFATDPAKWFEGSAYIKTSVPRSDGRFTAGSLPPGDYFVAAIEYSENAPDAGDVLEPERLSDLSRSAERITIGEGQQLNTELRLIRLTR